MAGVVAGRQQAGFIGSPAHPAGTASFQDCINHFCARLFSSTLVVSSVLLNVFMEVYSLSAFSSPTDMKCFFKFEGIVNRSVYILDNNLSFVVT